MGALFCFHQIWQNTHEERKAGKRGGGGFPKEKEAAPTPQKAHRCELPAHALTHASPPPTHTNTHTHKLLCNTDIRRGTFTNPRKVCLSSPPNSPPKFSKGKRLPSERTPPSRLRLRGKELRAPPGRQAGWDSSQRVPPGSGVHVAPLSSSLRSSLVGENSRWDGLPRNPLIGPPEEYPSG